LSVVSFLFFRDSGQRGSTRDGAGDGVMDRISLRRGSIACYPGVDGRTSHSPFSFVFVSA
jgi:hypothetical protein